MLSTNNSDAFLQKLAHIDQRERERHEKLEHDLQSNPTKTEEIVLLEKQGRSSQKMRNNIIGNLVQVSQSCGQNMTDISNIGNQSTKVPKIVTNLTQNLSSITQSGILPPRKDRSSSLPPSALPRPPRGLKPPRKIDYDRLNESDMKKRSQTPPKLTAQRGYELKTSSLKRGEFGKREYSPSSNFTIKHKNYGSISQGNDPNINEYHLKSEYPSTKNYQRLDDPKTSLKMIKESSKRSLLPSARNIGTNTTKTSRDSINSGSSGSNNSNNSRSSPVHIKTDSNTSNIIYHHTGQFHHSRTPPKYIRLTPPPNETSPRNYLTAANHKPTQLKLPSPTIYHSSPGVGPNSAITSLPPKADVKNSRRGTSITRGENRYRIQF